MLSTGCGTRFDPLPTVAMSIRMRRQAALAKKRDQRDARRKEQREGAVNLLKMGQKVAEVVRLTEISRGTAGRLQNCLKTRDYDKLSRFLDPANRAGGRPVIKPEEDKIIKQRIRYAASRGFAINHSTLRSIMERIANDGRDGFQTKNKLPSAEAVRSWRTQNRDITYRTAENKEQAKLQAENYEHVPTFVNVLKNIQSQFSGIFLTPERLWNMDETVVTT